LDNVIYGKEFKDCLLFILMKRGKKALSGVIVSVLIIFIVIIAVVFIYNFFIPIIQESAKQAEESSFTDNIQIERNSIILDDSLSLLELKIAKSGENKLSSIKAIVLVNGTSLSYNLVDVPKNLELRDYLLNITESGNIESILIYPILKNGKIGVGQRESITEIKSGEINQDLNIINPENVNNNCVSIWQCKDWSNCSVFYNLNNLILDEIVLKGEQNRLCEDKNKCNPDMDERKECDDKNSIIVKRVTEDGKDYVDVYDSEDKLISRLEYIPGEVNQLNIEIPLV